MALILFSKHIAVDIYSQIRGYFSPGRFSLIKIVSVKAAQGNKDSISVSFSLVLFLNTKVNFVATDTQIFILVCYYEATKFKRKASQDKSHLTVRDQGYGNSGVHNPSSAEVQAVNDHLEALPTPANETLPLLFLPNA